MAWDRVVCGMDGDFYVRIMFRNESIPSIYINDILIGENCYSIAVYNTNPFLSDPCTNIQNSGFDIYSGWDCAMMMQQQLSDNVICMLGIPIFYFKVDPDVDTKSYTFKEYCMHSVTAVKQIKMMIPDGEMPSSRPGIGEWDMDFETDWETELSKTQFATAFGPTAFPKQRDFIWVPMQKRMYMVNTAYEEKNENFLWKAVTWKLALVKWQEQDNVSQEEFEDVVDTLIVNTHDSSFATGETREGELTGERVLESPRYAATNLYNVEDSDWVRKAIDSRISTPQRQINHGNIIVSKNKYTGPEGAYIEYQKTLCGDEGTVCLIFDTPLDKRTGDVLQIGDWCLSVEDGMIVWGDDYVELSPGSTYMALIRWGRSTADTSLMLFEQSHPDVPSYKIRPNMYKFDFEDPVYSESLPLDENLIYIDEVLPVYLAVHPIDVCSLKIYDKYICDEDMDELLKYVPTTPRCIICDQCRPLLEKHGYSVK